VIESIRLYLRYSGIVLRGKMQYRASFIMLSVGQFLTILTEFLAIAALFYRFGDLRGWTLPEIGLLYGIVHISFSIAEGIGRGFDTFSDMIKSGDFDRLLLRPRSTTLQVAGRDFDPRVGRLIQAVFVLAWAIRSLSIAWTVPKVLLLLFAMSGSVCLFYGLFVLQATLCFWTVEGLEIMNAVTYGGTEAGQFPMTIYRPWFQRFFTFLIPLACVSYFPASVVLNRANSQILTLLLWLSPLAGVAFLGLSLQIWKLGVRHYVSTGS
jgi:ABC-2 type transport system permease protein